MSRVKADDIPAYGPATTPPGRGTITSPGRTTDRVHSSPLPGGTAVIDATTRGRLIVEGGVETKPVVRVAMSRLAEVREVLDGLGYEHWPAEMAIRFNGQPATTFLTFARGTDPAAVQAALDAAFEPRMAHEAGG